MTGTSPPSQKLLNPSVSPLALLRLVCFCLYSHQRFVHLLKLSCLPAITRGNDRWTSTTPMKISKSQTETSLNVGQSISPASGPIDEVLPMATSHKTCCIAASIAASTHWLPCNFWAQSALLVVLHRELANPLSAPAFEYLAFGVQVNGYHHRTVKDKKPVCNTTHHINRRNKWFSEVAEAGARKRNPDSACA